MDYAYHATEKKLLRRIAREGLLPKRQPVCHADEDRCVREAVIFFSPKPEWASRWGRTILRFPLPAEYEEDWYGDDMLVGDEILRTSYYTHLAISPEYIEVQVGRRWIPLMKF